MQPANTLHIQNTISIIQYICTFGCAGSSLLQVLFSSCSKQGLLQLRLAGFSSWGLLETEHRLGRRDSAAAAQGLSRCGSQAPEHRFNRCGTQAQLLCSMWNLPGPGIEPMSPALADGLFSTKPPGKPPRFLILNISISKLFTMLFKEIVVTIDIISTTIHSY